MTLEQRCSAQGQSTVVSTIADRYEAVLSVLSGAVASCA